MIPCSDGIKIHSWLLLHPDALRERNPTIVFFHGNAGNIGLRLPNAIQMYRDLNANVLLVEYRGYGDSDSVSPSEAGLKLDAEAALRFISTYPMIDTSRIFAFGRSLGGAVGFHLAQYAEKLSIPLAGVIVENTFLSVSHMVDHLMPYVVYLKPLVLRIGWDSYRIVPHLKVPTLYLAGSADTLVPHSHMLELYKASSKSSRCARMHVIPGGTHNETWVQGGREYWERIRSFLAEAYAIQSRGMTRSMSSMEDVPLDDFTNGGTSVRLGSVDDAKAIPTMPTNLVGMAIKSVISGSKPDTTHKKEM
jgi:pimeloyl-ACP methyl ester carboxylesterase